MNATDENTLFPLIKQDDKNVDVGKFKDLVGYEFEASLNYYTTASFRSICRLLQLNGYS